MEFEKLLKGLESNFSSASLRDLAATILRLADSIDQDCNSEHVRSTYPMFSRAARIERNAMQLGVVAAKEQSRAKVRDDAIGPDIIGIPAWNMLLELFRQFAGGAKVSTKSLQLIAGCPETTALRIIDRLEQRGLVIRTQSAADRRVTFINLTREGVVTVGLVLERLSD
ncbi:MarR family transcriptional regulator [Porphyrobacter sp. ULC335]|uniref:MarR family transcriptional regulator n=1 Tax=Porphyrobacter sp. ULC335 TaxID=2854260 RepID=UPI00221FDF03|nr:MarR family transcriptional regulator [Porphyrobacter sp. ULC335]UYV17054.1 MarR family transcriptional regulator [Porphyrobacter sp. ULC335]